jgi:hypothetical protein
MGERVEYRKWRVGLINENGEYKYKFLIYDRTLNSNLENNYQTWADEPLARKSNDN